MDTVEFPVLVTVRVCIEDVPTLRLPKPNAAGLAESCSSGETPVPLRATLVGEVEALLASVSVPA